MFVTVLTLRCRFNRLDDKCHLAHLFRLIEPHSGDPIHKKKMVIEYSLYAINAHVNTQLNR